MIRIDSRFPFTTQATLYIHRVSPSSEVPPTNGFYTNTGTASLNGVNSIDAYNSSTNAVVTGQGLLGIVGFCDFWVYESTTPTSSMSVNYTSAQEIVVTSNGYTTNYPSFYGLFYTFVCDSSC